MNKTFETIRSDTQCMSAEELLSYAVERFGRDVALASSMSLEDQVLTDMLVRITPQPVIFTIDTGRLPEETYDTIDETNKKYGIAIKVLFPDRRDVEEMVASAGPNLFRDSIEARKLCCHVRKVLPLQRALVGLDAWITGLRRGQSATRKDLQAVDWDDDRGLVKLNPLADWTEERVWQYIRTHGVPYNRLHEMGYPSIGCAPCTRRVEPGQDIRAGRWWWERPEQKECGLHVVSGRLQRAKEQ